VTDDGKRRHNRELLERNLASVGQDGSGDRMDTSTDDVVLELPYADPPVRLVGKEAIRARVGPALETFKFKLEITKIYECADPDTLIAEYTSVGYVTTTGKEYRNSYIGVFQFRDGLMCSQREYYNPLVMARALQPD
jgi:ketosteroid isomerase-like protein